MSDVENVLRESTANALAARRNRRRVLWIVIAAIVGTLLIAGGIAVAYAVSLANSYSSAVTTLPEAETFPDTDVRPEITTTDATNILLLGSDARGDLGDDLGGIRGQRSDTMMVVHIPGDATSVQVMSIMRDNWVPIPGHGEAKINAALALGGAPLAIQTVENLIGVRIDHVAIVDFEGFQGLTDALGGVTVDNEVEFERVGIRYPKGSILLDGEAALGYVRERHAFPDGDYQRIRNQEAYIRGVLGAVLDSSTLTDPGKVSSIVGAISPYLTVDAGLDAATVASLGLRLRDVRPDDIGFFSSPTRGPGVSPDGQMIVLPDMNELARVAEAFQTDTVAEYVAGLTR